MILNHATFIRRAFVIAFYIMLSIELYIRILIANLSLIHTPAVVAREHIVHLTALETSPTKFRKITQEQFGF